MLTQPIMAARQHGILIVDDLESDRRLLEIAVLRATGLRVLGLLESGEETIAYLGGTGKFADRTQHPFPDLLVLNLIMPRITGFDILAWLRGRPRTNLKVVVISGSLEAGTKARALEAGADYFCEKPMEFSGWTHIAKTLEQYLQRTAG
jgi:CheY-like chemotaxis protein